MSTPSSAPLWVTSGNHLTLPCLIDCHVHFREPGLEHKGNMQSEGEAARHGGISVACDMPNTSPPTQSIAALRDKVRRASEVPCELFFFMGATDMTHLNELEELWSNPSHATTKARCCGLKLYLDNSTGNMKSSATVTEAAFALCGRLHIPLVAHCEMAEVNDDAAARYPYDGPSSHSQRRPVESEVSSIQQAIHLAHQYRTPLHIAHLSTAGGLEAVRAARREHPDLVLTCEVAPHHLFLTTEDYSCCGSRVKVNPPLRPVAHHEALWEGLLDGTIDCIATDHAPHTVEEKEADGTPPSGMPSIEVVVSLLLTVVAGRWPHPTAPRPRALSQTATPFTVKDLVRVMHTNPNRIFQLGKTDVPTRCFDVTQEWVVDGRTLHSKCGWSPYDGWVLVGKALL